MTSFMVHEIAKQISTLYSFTEPINSKGLLFLGETSLKPEDNEKDIRMKWTYYDGKKLYKFTVIYKYDETIIIEKN